MLPSKAVAGIVEGANITAETWSDDYSAQGNHRVNREQRSQADQNKEDDRARKEAEQNLEKLWMDRLQLISIITTFFASTESQLLAVTTPNASDLNSHVEQAANAALTGALVLHSSAAILSFTAAFVLVRFRLHEVKREKGNNIDAEKQRVWSTNPHVAMQRAVYRQEEPPIHLLQRFSVLCIYMSVGGFCLAAAGILCFVWARQTRSVGIFSSVCLAGCIVAGLAVLFVSSDESMH